MPVTMTAQQLEEVRQRWAAEKERRAMAAHDAIQEYRQSRDRHRHKAALDAVKCCSLAENSDRRLLTVLGLIEFAPPEIFWPAFMAAWSQCDVTWQHRTRLLQAMNTAQPALAFLELSQRQFFDTLPSQVTVFRGCSASRVRAIAWTTSRAVAEGFARGHRGIPVPTPVVASAIIPKEHIFFVSDERAEKEIVLNPRRLREMLVEPFVAAQVERVECKF
jgi:hypothetical protein